MATSSSMKQGSDRHTAINATVKSSQDSQDATWLTTSRVFELLLAFRLLNALSLRTFFQPDEYYQALEPAWNAAFGRNSYAWITWEWHAHLRSSLHPAVFALAYRVARFLSEYFGLSPSVQAEVLLVAPKVVQAVIAAIGDLYTWQLAKRVYGPASKPAFAALALTVLNPWQWFCSTRTFSNGVETTLTVVALCYWPFSLKELPWTQHTSLKSEDKQNHDRAREKNSTEKLTTLRPALFLAALATLLRPTNIIIWATLTIYIFFPSSKKASIENGTRSDHKASDTPSKQLSVRSWSTISDLLLFSTEILMYGTLALAVSLVGDYLFYKQLTFPPWNFLVFNVFKSLAVFYGNNDWHYYLSQGYPLLLTTALPFTLIGMYQCLSTNTQTQNQLSRGSILRGLCVISITLPASLSVLSHKEVRFIYPLLPAFHVLAASPFSSFFSSIICRSNEVTISNQTRTLKRILLSLFILINATIAIYTSQIHNSGIISIPNYLRNEYEMHYSINNTSPDAHTNTISMTVAFLMPCHSIPWRSHIQYPPHNQPGIKAWALTCEPPLHITNATLKSNYRDEADLFYDDPVSWVRTNMARSKPSGQIDNRGTLARIDPGIYTTPERKKVWGKPHNSDQSPDITDLLPQLATHSFQRTAQHDEETKVRTLNELAGKGTSPASHIRRAWPHYLAFFAQLEPLMSSVLRGSGYHECWRVFNSHWHDDWRRTGDILVWCLRPVDTEDETGFEGQRTEPGELEERRHDEDVANKAGVVAEGRDMNYGDGGSSAQKVLNRLNEV